MSNEDKSTKIGAGHAAAMARQGLRELRAAVYPESNVAQHPEMGVYGSLTPGEVADSRKRDSVERDSDYDHGEEAGSVLAERLEQAQARGIEQGREDRSQERE